MVRREKKKKMRGGRERGNEGWYLHDELSVSFGEVAGVILDTLPQPQQCTRREKRNIGT
tara:strand:+ start:719 stop:895 length:177 start_codon:yes stop_codon:yes gene_type:complete